MSNNPNVRAQAARAGGRGGGHTPPPALTRPALFALTLLNYDLTPLGLWPQSQLLVLDLIPPHANFMTVAFMYVVNKKELVLNITYLNTIKFLAHLRSSHRGINLSRHFSVRGWEGGGDDCR